MCGCVTDPSKHSFVCARPRRGSVCGWHNKENLCLRSSAMPGSNLRLPDEPGTLWDETFNLRQQWHGTDTQTHRIQSVWDRLHLTVILSDNRWCDGMCSMPSYHLLSLNPHAEIQNKLMKRPLKRLDGWCFLSSCKSYKTNPNCCCPFVPCVTGLNRK